MKWVELSKAAMAARTWANPMCTPEMIVACDAKIKEVGDKGRNTEEGRKKFREYMVGKWIHVLPNGQVDLGYEELQKLNDIFNVDIDAINAPH